MMNYKKVNEETYDLISKSWDSKRGYVWKVVCEFLDGFLDKKDLRLLDLGCGNGRHLVYAQKIGFSDFNLVGCDFSQNQLSVTKEKGFEAVLADLKSLPFESNSFDIVICIASFHHLLDREEQLKALSEMRRVVKSNGVILLSNWFPEKDFLDKQIEKGKFNFIDEDKQKVRVTYTRDGKKFDRYYYLFGEDELKSLCESVNLKVRKLRYDKGNLYLELKS